MHPQLEPLRQPSASHRSQSPEPPQSVQRLVAIAVSLLCSGHETAVPLGARGTEYRRLRTSAERAPSSGVTARPLLVGVVAPQDFRHHAAATLVEAVAAATADPPPLAIVDENAPIGHHAERARLLSRLARICPMIVVTDSVARSAGTSTLHSAPSTARYTKIAPWAHYEDLGAMAQRFGLSGQVPDGLAPVLPSIQRLDPRTPIAATKRMRILETPAGLRLAGEFSCAPVESAATAVCDNEQHDHSRVGPPDPTIQCWAGFSVHAERWATHQYAPITGPFVEVALSGSVAVCGPPLDARHLNAEHQRLVTVTLTRPVADGYARVVDDEDGTVTLRPDRGSEHGTVAVEEICDSFKDQGMHVHLRSQASSAHLLALRRRIRTNQRPFPLP